MCKLAFDSGNNLTAVSGGSFSDGTRAWKVDPNTGQKVFYLYGDPFGGDTVPLAELDANGNPLAMNFTGRDGWRSRFYPGQFPQDGSSNGQYTGAGPTMDYYTYDPQGSLVERLRSTAEYDATGVYSNNSIPSLWDVRLYDAWGNMAGYASDIQGAPAFAPPAGLPPLIESPAGFGAQWGYQTDAKTGLIDCTHRYYSPQTRRWRFRANLNNPSVSISAAESRPLIGNQFYTPRRQ